MEACVYYDPYVNEEITSVTLVGNCAGVAIKTSAIGALLWANFLLNYYPLSGCPLRFKPIITVSLVIIGPISITLMYS